VGKKGFGWTGVKKISMKKKWPDWRPPEEMRQRQPHLPKLWKGGVTNPLGSKALYLGSSLYRIHGTNNSKSIGTASSSGCFRMNNGHIAHLYKIAKVGTTVYVRGKL
jgi:lipoprotein-anchoring transpeptidase ErfK/SrfK